MNWNAWTPFPSEYATRHITRAPLINLHSSTFFLISFGSFVFAFLVSPSHKWDAGKLDSENSLQFNIRRSTLCIPQVNSFLSFFKITFGHIFLNCSYHPLVTAKVALIAWILGNFILNKILIILFNNIPDTIYLILDWFGVPTDLFLIHPLKYHTIAWSKEKVMKKRKKDKGTVCMSLGRSSVFSSSRSLLLTTTLAAFFKTALLCFSFSSTWYFFKNGERTLP